MPTFKIKCSQRGCRSKTDGDTAPELCPVCNNPLLPGDAKASAAAPAPAPVSPGAGAVGGGEGIEP